MPLATGGALPASAAHSPAQAQAPQLGLCKLCWGITSAAQVLFFGDEHVGNSLKDCCFVLHAVKT